MSSSNDGHDQYNPGVKADGLSRLKFSVFVYSESISAQRRNANSDIVLRGGGREST